MFLPVGKRNLLYIEHICFSSMKLIITNCSVDEVDDKLNPEEWPHRRDSTVIQVEEFSQRKANGYKFKSMDGDTVKMEDVGVISGWDE